MAPNTKSTDIKGGPPHLHPAVSRRPHGANRFLVFSPKAGRRIDLFGIPQLQLWLRLEANPSVKQLCERPVIIHDGKRSRPADFWVAGPGLNKYLLVARREMTTPPPSEPTLPAFRAWATEVGCEVEEIQTLENSPDQETWYGNWTEILQQLSSFTQYLSSNLTEAVHGLVAKRSTLSELLIQFPNEEPELIRATVFKLVHQGVLRFVDLRKDRLSDLLEVEPE